MKRPTRGANSLAFLVENDGDKSRLYEEIGRFVFEYSQLEFELRRHFRRKVGYRIEFDDIMSAGFDFAKLCNALVAVSEIEEGGRSDAQLKKLINKCMEINAVRVDVVHGLWRSTRGGDMVVNVSRTSMKRKESFFENEGDLDKISDGIVKLRANIRVAVHNADERRNSVSE